MVGRVGIDLRQRHGGARGKRLLMIALVVTTSLCSASAHAQGVKPRARTEIPPPTQQARPDEGVPREIGQILEMTEEARRSGPKSVQHVRRTANTLIDWVRHLRIAIIESDNPTVAYDRENCQLLFELLQEVNPSAILGTDLRRLRQEIGDRHHGDPTSAVLQLQLDVERFRPLYPLQDLTAMASLIVTKHNEDKRDDCLQAIEVMLPTVALPNLDEPIARAFESYQEALHQLDTGKSDEARRLLKIAGDTVALLNVGTYLVESQWHLSRARDALRQGQPAITLASVRNADSLLHTASERAWPEFRAAIKAVRDETDRIIDTMSDRDKKSSLTGTDLRNLSTRIDSELRLPL
jgi:hypothetical protein